MLQFPSRKEKFAAFFLFAVFFNPSYSKIYQISLFHQTNCTITKRCLVDGIRIFKSSSDLIKIFTM